MALEMMKNIVEAEQKAENLKAKAMADSEQMKAEAAKDASDILSSVKKKAKDIEEQLCREAAMDAKPKVQEILDLAAKEVDVIEKKAESKRKAAVEAVVRKVVGKDGNC